MSFSGKSTEQAGGVSEELTERDAAAEQSIRVEVDETLCTNCSLCEERAPANIEMADDVSYARVVKQPLGESETENCIEAAEYCPTGGLTTAKLAD